MMQVMKIFILLVFLSLKLSALEIDQFTDRDKYQDDITDFTATLNQYTNQMIEKGVSVYNQKYNGIRLSQKEVHRYVAFEIYKTTAGGDLARYGSHIPSKINLFYSVGKSGLGPIQEWIESENNDQFWIFMENNIYSHIYPDSFNKNYIIKVGDEFMGPDKIDHFFDQGYSYWVKSSFGKNDEKARKFGADSEKGWYGLLSGGVFSFADLRANWGGYQFYKSLFVGKKSHLLVSDYGEVSIRRNFDWNEHVDWQFDELKNPSSYKDHIKKKIYRNIQKNIDSYCQTYEFLKDRDLFSWGLKRDSFYLSKELKSVPSNLFDIEELCLAR